MSQFVCVLHLDGRPVDRAQLERLTDTVAELGPDGRASHVEGALGMSGVKFATTPEAVHEALPLVDGELALLFDGRIDNRAELRLALRGRAIEVAPDAGDGAYVIAACRAWGEDAPSRLLGDFAFVLWDAGRRCLLAAVDPMGERALRWTCDGRTALFSTVFAPLVAHPDVSVAPNEGVVAEWIVGSYVSASQTLFAAVSQLGGGEQLTLVQGDARPLVRRYWMIEDELGPQFRTAGEAAEALRHVVTEAVACRLRVHGPVAAELSGGWDSSTVSVVAARLEDQGRAGPFSLLTAAFPGMKLDETPYVEAVERLLGRRAERREHPQHEAVTFATEMATLRHPFPRWPIRAVDAGRYRVVLSGEFGNETMGGFFEALPDAVRYVRDGHWQLAARAVRAAVNPYYRPLLPRAWHRRRAEADVPWLADGLATRVGLRDRLTDGLVLGRRGTGRQRAISSMFAAPWLGVTHGLRFGLTTGLHAEVRNPLLDVRLVRFALACPQRFAGTFATDPRRIHSLAFGESLPQMVTARRYGAAFDEHFAQTLAVVRAGRERAPLMVERGWIDPRGIEQMALPSGHWPGYLVYSIETWLQTEKT